MVIGFPMINQPFGGTPMAMETSIFHPHWGISWDLHRSSSSSFFSSFASRASWSSVACPKSVPVVVKNQPPVGSTRKTTAGNEPTDLGHPSLCGDPLSKGNLSSQAFRSDSFSKLVFLVTCCIERSAELSLIVEAPAETPCRWLIWCWSIMTHHQRIGTSASYRWIGNVKFLDYLRVVRNYNPLKKKKYRSPLSCWSVPKVVLKYVERLNIPMWCQNASHVCLLVKFPLLVAFPFFAGYLPIVGYLFSHSL